MRSQLLSVVSDQAALAFTLALLFLGAIAFPSLFLKSSLSKIPRWGEELGAKKRRDALLKGSKSIYLDGYRKVCAGLPT